GERPATLHITHSWGGGVAQWIESFIQADDGQRHFQFRSEHATSNRTFGQKLSLYAGNELRCPIASWWLQPPIQSITATDPAVKKIITEVCNRFGIGRVFVSSLIGHSLDVLRTGLPTIQVLHDHFPVWPLLGVNPEPYLSDGKPVDLDRALSDHEHSWHFIDQDGLTWSEVCADYLEAVSEFDVKFVAPGQWVLDLQNRIAPSFTGLESTVIPHGLPAPENLQPVTPRPRSDGRLRMVILGRMQEGKGAKLVQSALPELAKHVQVYLVGTGKAGEAFFGIPGINVISEYDHEKLGDLLNDIGPDFAALVSTVPETFSYTLSELQRSHVPTIATRLGSFIARVEHGVTGWLVDADAEALNKQVIVLCQDPGQIESVRKNLSSIPEGSTVDMVEAYNSFCPPKRTVQTFTPAAVDVAQVQWAAVDYQLSVTGIELRSTEEKRARLAHEIDQIANWARLERKQAQSWEKETLRLRDEVERLGDELEIQSNWAVQLNQDLDQERKTHALWLDQLDIEVNMYQDRLRETYGELQQIQSQLRQAQADFDNLQTDLQNTRKELRDTQADLAGKSQQLQQLQSDYQDVSSHLELVLQSKSWKITLPLRVSRRVLKNFMLARAWNPLRWPWLLSSLVRTLSTRGLVGTLQRIQAGQGEDTSSDDTETAGTNQRAAVAKVQADETPETDVQAQDQDDPVASTVIPGPFECPDQPDASIVIPVYNQWPYTAACLASLLEARCRHSFEVIIIDDQSSDETQECLAQVEGIKYFRNEQNQGFVGSCNRGAEQARGEFLVLLNNDTEVTDDWLDELIDTFVHEPEAGLVGSRLVYPDGKLQESGGVIFNDASGWNYGRGDDPERPEYKFLREADYCSGACIMLKTRFFRELGALDERYSPAYYEDTDLAFRVREAGYKVMVQPWSSVIHFEGATSGTDTSSGTKRYQLINQEKFLKRWREVLEHQPPSIPDPYNKPAMRKASNHRNNGQLLFIDAHTPEPERDSGSVRLIHLMKICRELGYGVAFFADSRVNAGRCTRNLQKSGIEVLYKPWLQS
ncbi:MAG: glycosyltransferase, partial [Xanthomonadales bacterium]|nr:glycosyltransferase [Xanthomonadales bacterium]